MLVAIDFIEGMFEAQNNVEIELIILINTGYLIIHSRALSLYIHSAHSWQISHLFPDKL